MTQLLDDLRALDALFSDESKWTQGRWARAANGRTIGPLTPNAVCWCLEGGAVKVANSGASHRYARMCEALNDATPRSAGNFVIWNDHALRKFHQVKALIARAIATEEGRSS